MSERWLDYRELATHWGIGPDAARARVRRGNFKRRTNNFGEVEVLVDTDAPIQRPRKRGQGGQTGTATPPNTPDAEAASAATAKALEALEGHVATLKEQLAKAEAATTTERERVADLTAQLLKLTAELLEARKAPLPPRSWWQRLVG